MPSCCCCCCCCCDIHQSPAVFPPSDLVRGWTQPSRCCRKPSLPARSQPNKPGKHPTRLRHTHPPQWNGEAHFSVCTKRVARITAGSCSFVSQHEGGVAFPSPAPRDLSLRPRSRPARSTVRGGNMNCVVVAANWMELVVGLRAGWCSGGGDSSPCLPDANSRIDLRATKPAGEAGICR